jgi:hypothetical protein
MRCLRQQEHDCALPKLPNAAAEGVRMTNQKLPWLQTMLVHSILKQYRSSYQRYDDTSAGMQLIDLLTPKGDAMVETGNAELLNLADFIAAAIAEQSPDEPTRDPRGFPLSSHGMPIEALCAACGLPMVTVDEETFIHDCECLYSAPSAAGQLLTASSAAEDSEPATVGADSQVNRGGERG